MGTWGAFVMPESGLALGSAIAGVAIFICAPWLPALVPSEWLRLFGCWLVLTAVAVLWMVSGAWPQPAALAAGAVALMVVTHRMQTRRPRKPAPTEPTDTSESEG